MVDDVEPPLTGEGPHPTILSKYKESFDLLDAARRIAVREFGYTGEIHLDDEKLVPQAIAVFFALRSLDTFDAIVYLAKAGFVTQAEILCRSLIELQFRFASLALSEDSAKLIVDQYLFDRRRMGKHVANWKDPKSAEMVLGQPIQEIRDSIEEEIKQEGAKYLDASAWAGRAGLGDLYRVGYAYLCGPTHSSMMNLQENHLILEGETPKSFRRGLGDRGMEALLGSAGDTLLADSEYFANVFGRNIDAETLPLRQKIRALAGA